jgi:hypothetical protein
MATLALSTLENNRQSSTIPYQYSLCTKPMHQSNLNLDLSQQNDSRHLSNSIKKAKEARANIQKIVAAKAKPFHSYPSLSKLN